MPLGCKLAKLNPWCCCSTFQSSLAMEEAKDRRVCMGRGIKWQRLHGQGRFFPRGIGAQGITLEDRKS